MELNELHVLQRGAGVVSEGVTVAGVLPAIAGNTERATDPSGRENHCFRGEELESSALTVVADGSGNPVAVLQQGDNRALHVHVDRLVHRVILQRANYLESGA